MNEFDAPVANDQPFAVRRRRLSWRTAMTATSIVSLLLGLPFVQRLMAAGLGAVLVALAALIGLQLLAFVTFKCLGLLPGPEATSAT